MPFALRFKLGALAPLLIAVSSAVASEDSPSQLSVRVGGSAGPAYERIAAALNDRTRMEFIETPLTDVVDYLKDMHNIEIQLDAKVMEDAGIGDDSPVTLTLRDVSLSAALRLMLRQLDLTYTILDGVLVITTPDVAAKLTDIRVYDASELIGDGQDVADLAEMLTELFSDQGRRAGTQPSRQFVPYGRFLVVRDTTNGHSEVVRFLSIFRRALGHPTRATDRQPPSNRAEPIPASKIRRDAQTRATRLRVHGGTEASERAVAAGLKWLAAHQSPDGSWSFDHTTGPCQNRCKNSGALADARTAATSMALLPFLGAGQSHIEGQYKLTVRYGLQYLHRSMKLSSAGSDLTETGGMMYSHGLATLVLCEGFALSRDKILAESAQKSLDFIIHAQDPKGGGWRYTPRQSGDTSVTGWQLMALHAGRLAGLKVPDAAFEAAGRFLDSVQADAGAAYGYTTPGNAPTTSAIGLLCRTYLGWDRGHDTLLTGAKRIAARHPSQLRSNHYYYNFFANQCLFKATGGKGDAWQSWNSQLRDHLIHWQCDRGHETGSWYRSGDMGADRGGRLYCTALSLLCLEVYYR